MTVDALEPGDVLVNDVCFITFNYDRSLETLLFHAFRDSFGTEDVAAAQAVVDRFQVLHVYGSVDGEGVGRRPYTPLLNPNRLKYAATGIRVIEETRRDDERFNKARLAIEAADVVCFLGFGFDQLNLRRLNLPSLFEHRVHAGRRPRILASVFGMTNAEVGEAQELVCGSQQWETRDMPNREFLRNIRW